MQHKDNENLVKTSQTADFDKKGYVAITGKLVALTAVHTGTGRGNDCTDAPFRRNSRGNWVLPGTAVGGVLRSLATKLAPRMGYDPCKALTEIEVKEHCDCQVCQLFGELKPGPDTNGKEWGKASLLWIYDAVIDDASSYSESSEQNILNRELVSKNNVSSQIRDGVGISRHTGTAYQNAKFDMEVLPAGTRFCLRIEIKSIVSKEQEIILAAVLAEWEHERAFLGGQIARGLGSFVLQEITLHSYDWQDSQGLLRYLQDDRPWENGEKVENFTVDRLKTVNIVEKTVDYAAGSFVRIRFPLCFKGPFLVNDPSVSGLSGFDHAPLQNNLKKNSVPVLPGSSLRGALRSHAGTIARTISFQMYNNFLVKCPACDPLEKKDDRPLAACVTLLERNKDRYPLSQEISESKMCLSCRLFGSTRRSSRLIIRDALTVPSYSPMYKPLDFLAIDRFTGGGKEEAKFDAVVLWNPVFQADIMLFNPKQWELGWLVLLLRDLAEGYMEIGFGSAKGFGQVSVPSYDFSLGYLHPSDLKVLSETLIGSKVESSGLYSVITRSIGDHYKDNPLVEDFDVWVKNFNLEIDRFVRDEDMMLHSDCDLAAYVSSLPEVTPDETRI